MLQSSTAGLVTLLTTYGYWAVFAGIAIESTGIPFPGETMLLVATMYAGTTHQLAPALIIAAAESFAILGDNLGFWVGREGGYRRLAPLRSPGPPQRAQVETGPLSLAQARGKVVFFGRFVAVLRMWAASLSGTNRMAWPRFLLFNAASGIVWASLVGLGGYFLGDTVHRLTGPVGIGAAALAGLLGIGFFLFLRTHQHRLEEEAERALPGPLDEYRKALRGERQSRLRALQTPGRMERSHQRIGEEQPTVLVCETFDRVGQAFAQRRAASQEAVPHGRSRKNRLSQNYVSKGDRCS